MPLTRRAFGLLAAATSLLPLSAAAEENRRVKVHFKPGRSGTEIKDKLRGYDTVDYILGASVGQTMAVAMAADNFSCYFNIYAPNAADAYFRGDVMGEASEAVLPVSGDYRIQVYLMRSAARRDETAHFTLQIDIIG